MIDHADLVADLLLDIAIVFLVDWYSNEAGAGLLPFLTFLFS
jgi:hypothetical protein